MKSRLIQGDCLKVLPTLPPRSVDLVFGSPPYEDARTYGIDFKLKGQDWVDWMVDVYRMCLSRCKGLVAFVVQGRTRKYKWSCTPALLIADLHRAGFNVRSPSIYSRAGIPGSGGPDWLRSDYEWIVCASHPGRLPWSDNIACGRDPKWPVGGKMSHRTKDGTRISRIIKLRGKDGEPLNQRYRPPKKVNPGNIIRIGGMTAGAKNDMPHAKHGGRSGTVNPDGSITRKDGSVYRGPERSNPGNVIHCNVGGGVMGSRLCHENEAPFPEKLPEFYIKSFCPPGGTVLDPFCGSGTTCEVAKKLGREYIGIDIRDGKGGLDTTRRRLEETRRKER